MGASYARHIMFNLLEEGGGVGVGDTRARIVTKNFVLKGNECHSLKICILFL